MKSFAEKVVLITGGASGIGAALASAFLAAGARVIICGRDEGRLAAARRAGVTALACDVTDETQLADLLAEVEQRFGRLDILVNNAGRMSHFDFRDAPLPAPPIAREIAVNLTAPIQLTNLALPLLRRAEPAAVVMIGSGYGWVPAAHAPVYSAAKAGLRAFAKALRFQLE
ncbi:MAG TPA: SDR family NAD(P)-dependent oxidoreductase, partial [Caulobacteraceae bacterium]|nr:SDR family NAD(P)-dependent oxidoreductase [Caulobacteraceae bacterium]